MHDKGTPDPGPDPTLTGVRLRLMVAIFLLAGMPLTAGEQPELAVKSPVALCLDGAGKRYALEYSEAGRKFTVKRFSAAGKLERQLGSYRRAPAKKDAAVKSPRKMLVDRQGNIFLSGEYLGVVSVMSEEVPPGEHNYPERVVAYVDGRGAKACVKRLGPDGKFSDIFTFSKPPLDFTVFDGDDASWLYVLTNEGVEKYNARTGVWEASFRFTGSALACDRQGGVYVVDGPVLVKLDAGGKELARWPLEELGKQAAITALAIDDKGAVRLVDGVGRQGLVYGSTGRFERRVKLEDKAGTKFGGKWTSFIDRSGVCYVADTDNDRVILVGSF